MGELEFLRKVEDLGYINFSSDDISLSEKCLFI